MRISVIGLGRLGAPLAAVLAQAGHIVIGVDRRQPIVDLVNDGRAPVDEPGLDTIIAGHRASLHATTDTAAAVEATDVTFIVVPTPSLPDGAFSNALILEAIEGIGRGLRRKDTYHVVAVTSTVTPLSMDGAIRRALGRASGRVAGHTVGLCYNPEFIALGSVIHDMMHPDLVLLGESDPRAGDVLESLHRTIVGDDRPIRRMNLVNAEVAKIAVNTFVTTKISYANMLAELCERLPGGDVQVVTDAIGADQRIGHRFFKGALGYGGPCFPRDNAAFLAVAAAHGAHAELAAATDAVNRRQTERLAALVLAQLGDGRRRVGILGLSYKPDTAVVDESQALMLANRLAAEGLAVTAYDPAACRKGPPALLSSVTIATSMHECVAVADVLVVAVPWPEFRSLPSVLASSEARPTTIVDCWRLLDVEGLSPDVDVVYVGSHRTANARAETVAVAAFERR